VIFEISTRAVCQLAFLGTICRTVTTGRDLTVYFLHGEGASEKDNLTCGKT